MTQSILLIFIFLVIIIYLKIKQFIKNQIKTTYFDKGMFPSKTGRYYIILTKNIITTDFYDADKCQWSMTKNPANILYFSYMEQ